MYMHDAHFNTIVGPEKLFPRVNSVLEERDLVVEAKPVVMDGVARDDWRGYRL